MKTYTCLVTGGAGFIGSHICEVLLAQGHEVIAMDNFYSGHRTNIHHMQDNPRFEVIRHDVVHPILLEVDRIFHFACPASPDAYQFNPVKTVKTSVMGTINMLGLAKRVKARMLLASTSEVYGDPKEHPQKETYWGNVNCTGMRSCYDEGKRVAETLMCDYRRQNNVDTKIIRIFNTYGPRMDINDGRVVSNFITQALRGDNITVYGDGSQTRSFCYVDDLVSGAVKMMDTDDFPGPVNIGNPGEFTIHELAEMVIRKTQSRSRIVYAPLPPDDPTQRQPDITLARTRLAWEPTVPLDEGLDRTIAYFRTVLSA